MVVSLEKAIDHAGTLDGKVTTEDIAHARRPPALSRGLSRVIARFQSQWSGDVERWKKLAPFMDADWPVKMQRQEKRAWWKDVAGKVNGFPSDPHGHHIHPFGWVHNFIAQGRKYQLLSSRASQKSACTLKKSRLADVMRGIRDR